MDKPLKSVRHASADARPTVTFPAAGHRCLRLVPNCTGCVWWQRNMCEQLAQGSYLAAKRPRVELTTTRVAMQRRNHYTTRTIVNVHVRNNYLPVYVINVIFCSQHSPITGIHSKQGTYINQSSNTRCHRQTFSWMCSAHVGVRGLALRNARQHAVWPCLALCCAAVWTRLCGSGRRRSCVLVKETDRQRQTHTHRMRNKEREREREIYECSDDRRRGRSLWGEAPC